MTPFSKLLSALRGEMTTHLSCHPHCSLGTYLFVDQIMISRQMPGYVPPGQKQPPMQLDIRFNLSGYLRKQGKAVG